jgi:hypothetical protein
MYVLYAGACYIEVFHIQNIFAQRYVIFSNYTQLCYNGIRIEFVPDSVATKSLHTDVKSEK